MKERDIQKAIKDYLQLTGWLVIKFPSVGIWKQKTQSYIPQPQRGVADLLAWKKRHKPLAVEVKHKSQPSEEQVAWGKEFEKHGGIWILARSVEDVEEVIYLTL